MSGAAALALSDQEGLCATDILGGPQETEVGQCPSPSWALQVHACLAGFWCHPFR